VQLGCGRHGMILLPVLFNIYVDELIRSMSDSGFLC